MHPPPHRSFFLLTTGYNRISPQPHTVQAAFLGRENEDTLMDC